MFSFSQAARLFTLTCDALIPIGLVVMLAEQLRLVDVERRAFEAIGRSLLLLVLALALLHIGLLLTSRQRALVGLRRPFIYLVVFIAISMFRMP